MVNSSSSVSRRGLYDWLIQRFSAVYMACYLAGLIVFILTHRSLSFFEWHQLFSCMTSKILTLLFFASLLWHAWIGIWTVLTDYVTCGCFRVIIQALILFLLGGSFFAVLLILWGV